MVWLIIQLIIAAAIIMGFLALIIMVLENIEEKHESRRNTDNSRKGDSTKRPNRR